MRTRDTKQELTRLHRSRPTYLDVKMEASILSDTDECLDEVGLLFLFLLISTRVSGVPLCTIANHRCIYASHLTGDGIVQRMRSR